MSNLNENKETSKVELGNYKGIKANAVKKEVTDQMVMSELDGIVKSHAKLEEVKDRSVEQGDTVSIDFEGFVEDKAFEGGKGENVDLEIGSKSFIPGFEEQIVGKDINDSFDINVAFPENYQSTELAGKDAVFKTKLNKISVKTLPEADDAFANEVAGAKSIEEFKGMIKERLEKMFEDQKNEQLVDQILSHIMENSTFELKDEYVIEQAAKMKSEYEIQLKQNGWTLENYLKMNGQTMEQFNEMLNEQANKRAKSILIVNAIAKVEGISISEEEMDAEYNNIAKMHGIPLEELKKRFKQEDVDIIKWIVTSKKVFDYLIKEADVA